MRVLSKEREGRSWLGVTRSGAVIAALVGKAVLIAWLCFPANCLDISRSVWAQQGAGASKPRAPLPKFSKDAQERFFDDVFSATVGPRPRAVASSPGGQSVAGTASSASSYGSSGSSPAGTPATGRWQRLISSDVLEDEVKAIKSRLDKTVTSPSDFAGRGYKVCRVEFSELAVLFAVIQEYDGTVRWKADAASARQAFARTAANCKVGSPQAYNEVKQRKQDLEELIRGGTLKQSAAEGDSDWSTLADRSPLMIRLERAFENQIRTATGSSDTFRAEKNSVAHEAQIVAMLAEVLCQPGMEDSGDSNYTGFARQMQEHALEIVEAVKRDDFAKAREAAGQIGQACTACHQNYR